MWEARQVHTPYYIPTQTIAAHPRWRSRTAVSVPYQSVLIALTAADDAALILDEHLAAAATAVAQDEPDTAAGVAVKSLLHLW